MQASLATTATTPNAPTSNAAGVGIALARCPDNQELTLVSITPPQTNSANVSPTSGAHCLVLDVSYSMDSEAKVKDDGGTEVSHGWSQLDIVKHAACTYVHSLGAEDYVCIVTYADRARVKLDWTKTTEAGKKELDEAIRALVTEGATNLTDGLAVGMRTFGQLPAAVAAAPQDYAMLLAVCTDGCPTAHTHPAGGASGYTAHVDSLRREVDESHGPSAVPSVTAIGFGNSLDSALLHSFSDVFLHIPDPGSVGPFMVNLLAAIRATARVGGAADTVTATHARLILEPASCVASVPGYTALPWRNGAALAVELGTLLYDGPRHVVVRQHGALESLVGAPTLAAMGLGGLAPTLTATLEVGGRDVGTAEAVTMLPPGDATFAAQTERTDVVCALQAAQAVSGDSVNAHTTLRAQGSDAQLRALAPALREGPLKETITAEALLALTPDKFRTWGKHYVRTLPLMLRAERRSNFRDACLQDYGKDARGRAALFEELCGEAEHCFATLTPPTPSLLERNRRPSHTPRGGGAPQRASSPPRYSAMPDEFMRGGGCFGPDATVLLAAADGVAQPVRMPVSAVRAGDRLVCEDGRVAPVRCVVLTECDGGKAQLTRLPNGTEITEWHPLKDAARGGAWRFPIMLGTQVVRPCQYVYNFVLPRGFPTILVDGIACAALGHGLDDSPVVAHPYWGTDAVIRDLMGKPGWEAGRIVLPAHKAPYRAP